MPSETVFKPKQQRSQDTQTKLLAALHSCLQDKFFEHISIKELADHAGVSVGTFYRRFKDKESLLPLLYQDFGNDLAIWVDNLELSEYHCLQDVIEKISAGIYQFSMARKSVLRTLHLNSRLHSTLLASDKLVDRKAIYQRLANLLLHFKAEFTVLEHQKAAENVIFIMITSLFDKVLYPSLTPAIASDCNAEEFSNELAKIVLPFLTCKYPK
ncbi:TetR/AcrR family transcriptional regulator [Thalassotalea piscium]